MVCTGLEFAYGIPGTVGGAVYMNAGRLRRRDEGRAGSRAISHGGGRDHGSPRLRRWTSATGTASLKTNGGCILSARTFRLEPGDPRRHQGPDGRADAKAAWTNSRWISPAPGSTFKRPEGAFAAALIDQCGLRGYRHGGAAVSEKHCGFVVNLGGATCADVLALCDRSARHRQRKDGLRPGKRDSGRACQSEKEARTPWNCLIVSGLVGRGQIRRHECAGGHRLFLR